MSGKAIAIVGARGMGKSTVTKTLAKKVPAGALMIYDPEGEHKDIYDKPLLSFKEFKQKADSVANALIIWEEATMVIPNTAQADQDVKEMLVKARHRNNTLIFVFHSFRFLPTWVFDLLDYIIVLKTADSLAYVNRRYDSERFNEVFSRINGPDNWLYNEEYNKYYSPHEWFSVLDIPQPKKK